MTTVQEST